MNDEGARHVVRQLAREALHHAIGQAQHELAADKAQARADRTADADKRTTEGREHKDALSDASRETQEARQRQEAKLALLSLAERLEPAGGHIRPALEHACHLAGQAVNDGELHPLLRPHAVALDQHAGRHGA